MPLVFNLPFFILYIYLCFDEVTVADIILKFFFVHLGDNLWEIKSQCFPSIWSALR